MRRTLHLLGWPCLALVALVTGAAAQSHAIVEGTFRIAWGDSFDPAVPHLELPPRGSVSAVDSVCGEVATARYPDRNNLCPNPGKE
jgi:hypothetical protein